MSEKIYLNLLILCGILSHGIIGTFLEDNHKNSSNLHFRKKRMINQASLGHKQRGINIVKIVQNQVIICAGVIVSPEHILTAYVCADEAKDSYVVVSHVQNHHISHRFFEGRLALLLIEPHISFASPSLNQQIEFYTGPPPQLVATILGWQHLRPNDMSGQRVIIQVPIFPLLNCIDFYKVSNHTLTQDNVCTTQLSEEKRCTLADGGSALVLDQKLYGVLIYPGSTDDHISPDVFARVVGNAYYNWIMNFVGPYHVEVNEKPHLSKRVRRPSERDPHYLQLGQQHANHQK